jgi:hypothetical protein
MDLKFMSLETGSGGGIYPLTQEAISSSTQTCPSTFNMPLTQKSGEKWKRVYVIFKRRSRLANNMPRS